MSRSNQRGLIHLIPVVIILIGMIASIYLVQKTQIFKPKANEDKTIQVLDKNNNPTDVVNEAEINLIINLPKNWKLENSSQEAEHVLKGLYLENKDDGVGGHESFSITPDSPDFSNYINKKFYWKLNELNQNQQSAERIVQLTLFDGSDYTAFVVKINLTKVVQGNSNTRTASILKLPFRSDMHCFQSVNENKPECGKYYENKCVGQYCNKELVCDKYYNPVVGNDGYFYPTACWAESLGTSVARYGYTDEMTQFFKDLWKIKTKDGSYEVPDPHISFIYGVAPGVSKGGTYFRSVLWLNSQTSAYKDFDVATYYNINSYSSGKADHIMSYNSAYNDKLLPAVGSKIDVPIIFIKYDDSYQDSLLVDLTKKYEALFNDYLRKKIQVDNPVQFNLHPVFISPPPGTEDGSFTHDSKLKSVYQAAINKLPESENYKIVVAVPVKLNITGGFITSWNNLDFIVAPLGAPKPYSVIDKKAGLDAIAAFQKMMVILTHEVIHSLGMSAEHMELGYTRFLEADGQYIDTLTGRRKDFIPWCDYIGNSADYYAVELPSDLSIKAGEEPDWLERTKSINGDCISPLYQQPNGLKNYNNDGEYKIVYRNNMIDKEMQRMLGWVDIDGDSVAEIEDPDPYGGVKIINSRKLGGFTSNNNPSQSFEFLEEVTKNDCKFAKVKLENGKEGLVPLQCAEFNDNIVNLYQGMKYYWTIINKDYGAVFLAGYD